MAGHDVDWVTLRLFLAALELGSIARAARHCGIAHSAAAKRLRVLEADHRLALLERGARGVRPTPAGEALAQHARALFDLSARMSADLRAFAAGGRGSVRLHAAPSVIAGHGVGELLAGFRSASPGIRVELREGNSLAILHDLSEGRADLGLITGASEVPAGLEGHSWRHDRLVVAMPPDHPLADSPGLRFEAVLDHPLVDVQRGAVAAAGRGRAAARPAAGPPLPGGRVGGGAEPGRGGAGPGRAAGGAGRAGAARRAAPRALGPAPAPPRLAPGRDPAAPCTAAARAPARQRAPGAHAGCARRRFSPLSGVGIMAPWETPAERNR
ncbi:LysR family transcriptional regulator [Roseomonas sp. OT10]|nr:LysR family transcriptional regulator [Roseomonas sp. OT10]UFN48640.1 LysR family transcriptional regulator [Roseomonas sp. OT10]